MTMVKMDKNYETSKYVFGFLWFLIRSLCPHKWAAFMQ